MKRTPDIIHLEQSKNNTSTVPAYAGKNKALLRYLKSPKFERDFEQAIKEKAEVR